MASHPTHSDRPHRPGLGWLAQVAVLIAAFVVYDMWRGSANAVTPADAQRGGAGAPSSSPDAENSAAPADASDSRLADLLARVEQLEAARREAPQSASAARVEAARPIDLTPFRRVSPGGTEFSAEDVARFVALQAAVLHQRRGEQVAKRLAEALASAAEPPTAEERAGILEASLAIWDEAERLRTSSADELGLRERANRLQDLDRELHTALGRLIPGARGNAIHKLVRAKLGLGSAAALDAGAGAQAAADNPPPR